ncbi:hypothetical protein GSH19_04915 [Lactobacillus sp. S2-2]|uniref:hypothetical protein n=1 Tax=Lactobacillus sp. S2-2 TaxID=2692917 RepID=UPI001F2DD22F|nr:hypothetical protein [Lactobacillus sp. S2-2]MCF6515492.1 hypothetical protein [Lactobacillus sp. S2-2]
MINIFEYKANEFMTVGLNNKKILELTDKLTKFDEKNKKYYWVLLVPLLTYYITISAVSSFINNTYIAIITLFLFLHQNQLMLLFVTFVVSMISLVVNLISKSN